MNNEVILALAFIVFFMAGVCLVGLVEKIKARRKYVKRLESDNQKLRQENRFLLLEIRTRGL